MADGKYQELEGRIAMLEKQVANLKVVEERLRDGGKASGGRKERQPQRTLNEEGYCVGDKVEIKKDRDYWTKRKGPYEGQSGKVYAVTLKMVRMIMEVDGEKLSKYNTSVKLVQIGEGNNRVMKPKLYSKGKDWEVVERHNPKV